MSVIYLDHYRKLPSISEQMEVRENLIRQAVMELYADEPMMAVACACTAAAKTLKQGGTGLQAMDAAEDMIHQFKHSRVEVL